MSDSATSSIMQLSKEEEQKCYYYIQAQARVAFSKMNRNSGIEIEDLIAIGYEVLDKARKSWNPEKNTKFNTYLTMLLQSRYYKEMARTHRKKRGGAGNKKEDIRFGRAERWENGEAEKEAAVHISIDSKFADGSDDHDKFPTLEIAAPSDNSAEYELLVEQVAKKFSPELKRIYKQMVDPDEELLKLAVERVKDTTKKCVVDTKLIAEYLHMDITKLRGMQRTIKDTVAAQFGYRVND